MRIPNGKNIQYYVSKKMNTSSMLLKFDRSSPDVITYFMSSIQLVFIGKFTHVKCRYVIQLEHPSVSSKYWAAFRLIPSFRIVSEIDIIVFS